MPSQLQRPELSTFIDTQNVFVAVRGNRICANRKTMCLMIHLAGLFTGATERRQMLGHCQFQLQNVQYYTVVYNLTTSTIIAHLSCCLIHSYILACTYGHFKFELSSYAKI